MNDSSKGSQSDKYGPYKAKDEKSNIENRKNSRDADLTTKIYLSNE
jgi:hypothetical protein